MYKSTTKNCKCKPYFKNTNASKKYEYRRLPSSYLLRICLQAAAELEHLEPRYLEGASTYKKPF
jgi:hypothetical protein